MSVRYCVTKKLGGKYEICTRAKMIFDCAKKINTIICDVSCITIIEIYSIKKGYETNKVS